MSNQLIKETALGREQVFPKNYILNLKDKDSGANLEDILKSFNMLFLPYLDNKSDTRKQVPMSLRHGGLWITYIVNGTVVTEWYNSTVVDDYTWGSDAYWREGSNMLVGDISISKQGTWVINGEDTGISPKGDKGDSSVIRIYNNRILVSYDNGVTYEDLNNTPVYTKFRFNSLTNTYQVSYDLGTSWEDISDEKVYHKFRYNEATNTYLESFDFGKTWSNVSAESVYYQFRFNKETNTYQVSKDLGKNWTDVNSNKVYYQFRYNPDTNTHLVSTDFGNTWTNISEDKVFYKFRTNENKLQVSTDLGTTWEDCSELIAAWFRWASGDTADSVGKLLISRDELKTWTDLSPNIINNLRIKGYVATVGNLPSNAALGDIYMVGPTYDESDITHDYPHHRMWIKQSSGWVDNGEYLSNVLVSQLFGNNSGTVISLKFITEWVNKGYQFRGIATPTTNPGTPDGPVFYLATEVGIYSNFNNIEVTEGEAVVFKWNNDAWSKNVTGFATQEKLSELDSQIGKVRRLKEIYLFGNVSRDEQYYIKYCRYLNTESYKAYMVHVYRKSDNVGIAVYEGPIGKGLVKITENGNTGVFGCAYIDMTEDDVENYEIQLSSEKILNIHSNPIIKASYEGLVKVDKPLNKSTENIPYNVKKGDYYKITAVGGNVNVFTFTDEGKTSVAYITNNETFQHLADSNINGFQFYFVSEGSISIKSIGQEAVQNSESINNIELNIDNKRRVVELFAYGSNDEDESYYVKYCRYYKTSSFEAYQFIIHRKSDDKRVAYYEGLSGQGIFELVRDNSCQTKFVVQLNMTDSDTENFTFDLNGNNFNKEYSPSIVNKYSQNLVIAKPEGVSTAFTPYFAKKDRYLYIKSNGGGANIWYYSNRERKLAGYVNEDSEGCFYIEGDMEGLEVYFTGEGNLEISNQKYGVFYVGSTGYLFSKLRPAFEYAIRTRNSKIIVRDGVYNLIEEYADEISSRKTTQYGLALENGLHAYFESGVEVHAMYEGDDETVTTHFSPFYAGGNGGGFILENVYLTAKNTRYCVHDDLGNHDVLTHNVYKSCRFIYDNTTAVLNWFPAVIGGGSTRRLYVIIEDCFFSSKIADNEKTPVVSYHNSVNFNDAEFHVILKNCYFTGLGTYRTTWIGNSQKISRSYVSGCSFNKNAQPYKAKEGWDPAYTTDNVDLIAWNNEFRD